MKRLFLLCGAMTGLLLLGRPLLALEAEEIVNPHGSGAHCLSCHDGGDEVGQPLPVVPTCRKCHPEADIHPVQIAPKEVFVPEDWPLEGGLVVCSTCHAEPSCDSSRAKETPYYRGGYKGNARGFCFLCHDRKKYERVEPHHPQSGDSTSDQTCVACHISVPEDGADPSSSFLRATPLEVCSECHQQTVHAGVGTHMGRQLEADVSNQLPPNLPLAPDRTIACWTCHDVHEHSGSNQAEKNKKPHRLKVALQELASSEWELPSSTRMPGEFDAEHPPLLALENGQNQLCLACHVEQRPSTAGSKR
ncbi:MAG: hypothetical protein HN348_06165 [Proteobacteria bacterium]|jgi:hypothetical protein|nr:hypothetical protein [Pseudomonadota bacterium]